jgi:hypothetical protein
VPYLHDLTPLDYTSSALDEVRQLYAACGLTRGAPCGRPGLTWALPSALAGAHAAARGRRGLCVVVGGCVVVGSCVRPWPLRATPRCLAPDRRQVSCTRRSRRRRSARAGRTCSPRAQPTASRAACWALPRAW